MEARRDGYFLGLGAAEGLSLEQAAAKRAREDAKADQAMHLKRKKQRIPAPFHNECAHMEMAITRASQGMVRHWIASHGVRPIAAGAGPEAFYFPGMGGSGLFFFASRPFQVPRTSELPLSLLWTIQLFPRRLISWPWQLGAAFCHTPCY